jgi:hypothetical protein
VPLVNVVRKPFLIPRRFESTHPTAGLDGYPARDFFMAPDQLVVLADAGVVSRLSGHCPSSGDRPGGACGFSIYVQAIDGGTWFLTHFAAVLVRVGEKITPTVALGTCVKAACGPRGWVEHIHAGRRPPSA